MGRFEVLRSTVLFFLLMITSTQATPFADPPSSQNGHFFQKSLLSAIGAATYQLHASSTFMKIIHNSHKHNRSDDGVQITKAAADCLQLLDHTAEELLWVFEVAALGRNRLRQHRSNLNAWLSASMTNQETCLEEFEQTREEKTKIFVRALLNMMIEKLESILSMVKGAIAGGGGPLPYSVPPGWLAKRDIKLLMSRLEDVKIDVTVAKDGSGNYTSIMEAVQTAVPYSNNNHRFVIYVKEGKYNEVVRIDRSKKNLAIIGDGMQKTIITSNRSVGGGFSTYESATFGVDAPGFIGRDLTFHNGAGPTNHQAVAFRSRSDLSVCYRCRFEGYQDTLYAHSLRQMYRDCHVLGTVDFIFGNAAAAFQNCHILARKPNPGQFNAVTAQKRSSLNQTTGFSFHDCRVDAEASLRSSPNRTRTYLGRPWGPFATVVFMQTYLSEIVDQAGWRRWNSTTPADRVYYGEYKNTGPGSDAKGRVNWTTFHVLNQPWEVYNMTAFRLIDAYRWLPITWWGLDLL